MKTITVSDTTHEGHRTYLVDGVPAYCSSAAPEGCVALQTGDTQVFVREADLPNFRQSFVVVDGYEQALTNQPSGAENSSSRH